MEGQVTLIMSELKRYGVLGEELDERLISIGPESHPVWIGKQSEAQQFFTPYFYFVFEVWRKFKSGFGLPYGGSWIEKDQDLIDAVLMMQEHYEAHYKNRAIISRLDALLQRG
jgi:hypothetical protein